MKKDRIIKVLNEIQPPEVIIMENKKEIDSIQLLADIKVVVEKHGAKISEYSFHKCLYCLDLEIVLQRNCTLP